MPLPQHLLLAMTPITSTDTASSSPAPFLPRIKPLLLAFICLYLLIFLLLTFSHRVQTYLIYMHWLRPPFFYPLHTLEPYRLASSARVVSHNHLRGWHLLPPGPPFVDGSPAHFDTLLSRPDQRVVIFFHGNSGTRSCPTKRVDSIKFLAAHLRAHVITFDYSGFGDSSGRPSEQQLNDDAAAVFQWVHARVAPETDVIVYGQSLGTFAAVDLAANLSRGPPPARRPRAVILDAPPASLIDAALTHPIASPFRVLPYMPAFFRYCLKEKLDSIAKIRHVSMPLLILHGERDAMIGVEQGEKLYQAARGAGNDNVRFVRFPDRGHNDVNRAPHFLRVLHSFLDDALSTQCRIGREP